MSAAAIPSGWGFRPTIAPRTVPSERRLARRVLAGADPALRNVPAGVLARDLADVLGISYRAAYRAAQAMKQRTPRGAW